MAVLKSTSPSPVLTPFSIKDMELQAQALLVRSRRAAELLLGEAQREGELLKAKAREEGFALGKREGTEQGLVEGRKSGHDAALAEIKPQMAKMLATLTAAVNQLDADRHDLECAGINEVVKLAAAIARRVTKRQAAIDPAVLLENLKEAMKLAVGAADVRIMIHPDQRQMLESELPRLQMQWPTVKHVSLIDDVAVGVGGCKILTRQGEVDASIEAQLDRVIADVAMDGDA
jgi:flagellar assembly protein FliH